jgi:hypothetical protein
MTLTQGNRPVEDYFLDFELLANYAGYEGEEFDSMKMSVAEENMNQGLIRSMYTTQVYPDTWEKFKKAAIALDGNFRTFQAHSRFMKREKGQPASRFIPRSSLLAPTKLVQVTGKPAPFRGRTRTRTRDGCDPQPTGTGICTGICESGSKHAKYRDFSLF